MSKKSLIFWLIPLIFSFVSCYPNFSVDEPFYERKNINKEIKKKRSLNDFSSVKNPLILTRQISDIEYLPYAPSNTRPTRDGNLVFVLDLDTDTVFDWYYTENWRKGRALEIGSNPIKYVFNNNGSYSYFTKNDRTEKTVVYNTDTLKGYGLASYTNYSLFIPLYEKSTNTDYSTMNYFFINEEHKFPGINCSIKMNRNYYNKELISDRNGNWWVETVCGDYCHIYKINPNKGSNAEIFQTYPINKTNGKYTVHKVVGVEGNLLFVSEYIDMEEKNEALDSGKLLVYDINTKDKKNDLSIKYPCAQESESYIMRLFKIGDYYYVFAHSYCKEDGKDYLSVTKFNLDGYSEILQKKAQVDFCSDIFVYEKLNRVYFFVYQFNDPAYCFYDVGKNSFSNKKIIRKEDICGE